MFYHTPYEVHLYVTFDVNAKLNEALQFAIYN